MKNLSMRLLTPEGDELDCIPVEAFVIAEEWDEPPPEDTQGGDIISRVDALFTTILTMLRERQAAPLRSRVFLKLALGEVLLTADEFPGDIVLDVTVRSLAEGEGDEFDEAE